jgi:hypothetical protein
LRVISSARLLAALGALLEHHLERDQEQHDAAGDAERIEADAERAQQILADSANTSRIAPRPASSASPSPGGAPAIAPASGWRRSARSRRVDHHE